MAVHALRLRDSLLWYVGFDLLLVMAVHALNLRDSLLWYVGFDLKTSAESTFVGFDAFGLSESWATKAMVSILSSGVLERHAQLKGEQVLALFRTWIVRNCCVDSCGSIDTVASICVARVIHRIAWLETSYCPRKP